MDTILDPVTFEFDKDVPMQARDIAVSVPTITLQDTVAKAVQVMALGRLPGLIVVDAKGKPVMVLPGSQVLRLVVPATYQSEPALAHTIDEEEADRFWLEPSARTVGQCLPDKIGKVVTVSPEANLLEIAAAMALARSPLVAVAEKDGELVGAITIEALATSLAIAGLGT
ncbi:MAG TPA: CBS domain-containing protein [Pseudolysinimonas sp.]|nr:CBS domain-containing protein [Pseudolysinimonas sp.]